MRINFSNIRKLFSILIILFSARNAYRNITISGNATLGYYYVDAYIGTPPQPQSLILDTGSNLTILPCKGCEKCNDHIHEIYDPDKSSTSKKLDIGQKYVGWKCPFFSKGGVCGFTQGYTEGSMYKGKDMFLDIII
jgi:hypothetical protein